MCFLSSQRTLCTNCTNCHIQVSCSFYCSCYCDWKWNAPTGLNQHFAETQEQLPSFQFKHKMIHHCVLLQWPHVFHRQYIKFHNFRFSPALEKKKNREQLLFQFQNCPRCEHFETYNIQVLEPLSFSSRSHGPCNPLSLWLWQWKSTTSVWSLLSLLKQQSSCSELTGSPRRPALLPVPT